MRRVPSCLTASPAPAAAVGVSPSAVQPARAPRPARQRLAPKRAARSRPTQPSAMPRAVSRRSALSARSVRRYSAREVNMRYGSVDTLRDQVVDQHADIGLGAVEHEVRPPPPAAQRGIDAGHQTLRRRLLVAGGAVDLAGQEQAAAARAAPASGRARADRRSRIRSRSRAAASRACSSPGMVASSSLLDVARQRGRDAVRDRPCRRPALPARGRSGGRSWSAKRTTLSSIDGQ